MSFHKGNHNVGYKMTYNKNSITFFHSIIRISFFPDALLTLPFKSILGECISFVTRKMMGIYNDKYDKILFLSAVGILLSYILCLLFSIFQ